MQEAAARRQIVDLGRSMFERGLTPGRTGNLSVRTSAGRCVVTPSGASLGSLSEEALALLDGEGRLLDGPPATKEAALHMALYGRPGVGAVVHLHSPWAVAYSCRAQLAVERPLPFLTPYLVMRAADLRLVDYAPPGSEVLAGLARAAAAVSSSLLLRRHGTMIARASLEDAVDAAEEIEHAARIAAAVGEDAVELTPAEIAELGG